MSNGESPRTEDIFIEGVPVRAIRIYGTGGSNWPASVDEVASALTVIGVRHSRVHQGAFYTVPIVNTLTALQSKFAYIKTPNKIYTHVTFLPMCEGPCSFVLWESPVITNTGSQLLGSNRNRNVIDNALTKIYRDPIYTSLGTPLQILSIPSSGAVAATSAIEWILRENTGYLVHIQNRTTSSQYSSVEINWYERPPYTKN